MFLPPQNADVARSLPPRACGADCFRAAAGAKDFFKEGLVHKRHSLIYEHIPSTHTVTRNHNGTHTYDWHASIPLARIARIPPLHTYPTRTHRTHPSRTLFISMVSIPVPTSTHPAGTHPAHTTIPLTRIALAREFSALASAILPVLCSRAGCRLQPSSFLVIREERSPGQWAPAKTITNETEAP